MVPEPLSQGAREGFPKIPGYELEEMIGRGSTGVVYRARQLAIERLVALKVLHRELAGRGQAIRRLQREARTTARLSHPSIISAIDMGETGGLWWYAMELVDGESLSQRMREKGRLSEREALRLFIPLCEALQHAHEHGVVHRDIKPANILVDREGRPHLVDLGLAVAEDDPGITRHGGTLGTPHYISPEQARSPQSADIRSDIWSLGATLYHCLCGRPPFEGQSVAEILSGVLYARIEDPLELAPNVSKGMALVLRKCLSRAPERRYQTPSEMLQDLELLRERREVRIKPSTLDPVADHRNWRKLVAAGLLPALALVCTVWLVWYLFTDTPPAAPIEKALVPTRWEALERISEKGRRGSLQLASAITELESLKPVPSSHQARYDEVARELADAWQQAATEYASKLDLEFQRRMLAKDFVGAQELVDAANLDADLRARFSPGEGQLRELHERLRDDFRRTQVEHAIESEFQSDLAAARKKLTETIFPEAQRLSEHGQWRSARAEIGAGLDESLRAIQGQSRKVPEDFDAQLTRQIRGDVERARSELEARWVALDGELERAINARADEIEAGVQSRSLAADGAADSLRTAFERELAREHLVADQMLADVSDRARTALERRLQSLTALQETLAAQDAETWARLTESEAAELWKERNYPAVRERWEEGRDRGWTARVGERLEAEVRWSELLQGLLERAAKNVRDVDGGTTFLFIGSIRSEGQVRNAQDPLGQGFGFLPKGAREELLLSLRRIDGSKAQMLPTEAIERIVGWPANPADIADPDDRLLRTLFRYREGDVAGAWATYRSGDLPPASREPVLTAELNRRLAQSADAQELQRAQKIKEAKELYGVIQRLQEQGDAAVTCQRIDKLLANYGELAWVKDREEELRSLRERLAVPQPAVGEASLKAQFGPTQVELDGRHVRMEWEFTPSYQGAFQRGDWTTDPTGWRAKSQSSKPELFEPERWPRLFLQAPLDLDDRVEIDLEFDQPESGPARLLALSLAGWQVAIAAPERTGEAAHWVAVCGDDTTPALRNAVDEALAGNGQKFEGIKKGGHRLRAVLTQRRGQIELFLDGVRLGQVAAARPDEKGATVVVRSLEIVRLRSARIDAQLVR